MSPRNPITKNKGGRPPFVIDFVKLKALAQIQCTDAEIAAVLGCSLPPKKPATKAKGRLTVPCSPRLGGQ